MKPILHLTVFSMLAPLASADVLYTDTGNTNGDGDLSYDMDGITVIEDSSENGYGNGNVSIDMIDVGGGQVGSKAVNVFYGRFLWAPGDPNDYINFSTVVGAGRISFHSDNNADQGGTRVRLFDTTGAPVPNLDIDPLPTGTTLVVFRVEMSGIDRAGDETVKIWYNPTSIADVTAGTNPSGTAAVDMLDNTNRGFGVNNPQIGGNAGITQYDNIVFGDTAFDVLPSNDTTPLKITKIDHDTVADSFRLSWSSQPGETYALFYGIDLETFDADISDSIESQGELTVYPPLEDPPFPNPTLTPGPRSPKLFFRVQRN